jgi:BirA family biotin operon repressor/biotin-[acetyl-CoA-carboxylase] ligase
MPHAAPGLVILEQVDSTNNYAMAMVHAGMANHGNAWFCSRQSAGKGQRGKHWNTGEGENIGLSITLNPKQLQISQPFQLLTVVALACHDFFASYTGDEASIKWPNDIYWRDRKAGGVLVENKYSGTDWKWAVVGIGLNVNQEVFDPVLANPVSMKQVTGRSFDLVQLAGELRECVMERAHQLLTTPFENLLREYNSHLYKVGQPARLKKGNIVFETTISGVTALGELLTKDAMERQFAFGEVEWII